MMLMMKNNNNNNNIAIRTDHLRTPVRPFALRMIIIIINKNNIYK